MKTFNRIILLVAFGYSCLSITIFVYLIHKHHFFYQAKGQWTLVWDDDFNGPGLDPKKWAPVYRSCDYNGHQKDIQAIIHENVTVKDGNLILRNKAQSWREEDGRDSFFQPIYYYLANYTSGQVTTGDKCVWTYGRFEIRAKLPVGDGLFSYASLYPADGKLLQEIIIMRMFGHNPYRIYFSNHWGTDRPHRYLEEDLSSRSYGPDYSADFHTFTVEWEPGVIRWYVDNVKLYQTKRNVPEIPLSLNLGTASGNLYDINPKFGSRSESWSQYFIVDWIRVYRRR